MEVIEFLVESGIPITNEVLQHAVYKADHKIVKYLVDSGAEVKADRYFAYSIEDGRKIDRLFRLYNAPVYRPSGIPPQMSRP